MKVTITAKKLNISQSFTDYAEQKLNAKLDRFFPEEAEAKITLAERREMIILELTVKYNGIIYRAEQTAKDKNDALDVTVDRIIRQIRKQKTKVEKSLRAGAFAGHDGGRGYSSDEPAGSQVFHVQGRGNGAYQRCIRPRGGQLRRSRSRGVIDELNYARAGESQPFSLP